VAKYNEILVGRFNNALKKLFGMKGPAPSPQVSGEIAATLAVPLGVEFRFLEEWTRFAATEVVAGVAAQAAAARIRNPIGSNVIAVVEKACFSAAAVDNPKLQLSATAADLGTADVGNRLDSRGRPQTSLIVSKSGTGVALTNTIEQATIAANVTYDFILFEDHEITLLPGDALQLISNVLNQQIITTMVWRERFLEDSERA
jgi:hypothetical protein